MSLHRPPLDTSILCRNPLDFKNQKYSGSGSVLTARRCFPRKCLGFWSVHSPLSVMLSMGRVRGLHPRHSTALRPRHQVFAAAVLGPVVVRIVITSVMT